MELDNCNRKILQLTTVIFPNSYIGLEDNDVENVLNIEIEDYKEDYEKALVRYCASLRKFTKNAGYYVKFMELERLLDNHDECVECKVDFDKAKMRFTVIIQKK